LLAFLPAEGPGQLATGALITFIFLLLHLACQPYCTQGLNSLQSFSLISQFLTLFCGILIGYMQNMARTGSDASEQEDARVFGSIIVTINCSTLVFPLLRKYTTGTHVELIETLIAVATFPLTCWMKWCGGQKRRDARIAKEQAEEAARLEALLSRNRGIKPLALNTDTADIDNCFAAIALATPSLSAPCRKAATPFSQWCSHTGAAPDLHQVAAPDLRTFEVHTFDMPVESETEPGPVVGVPKRRLDRKVSLG
jgi:hypothetical protein